MPAQANKPIRAKLGEESSFVYDPELKRWINKKGGDTAPTPTATPPPPRAGPPRTASSASLGPTSNPRPGSAAGPPPSPQKRLPSQRAVSESSPLGQSDGSAPPTLGAGFSPDPTNGQFAPPPLMARTASNSSSIGGVSGPPSRPGTGMSNASSIDDLLGPAMPRKGGKAVGGVKGKKKGRGYVDVMGDKGAGGP